MAYSANPIMQTSQPTIAIDLVRALLQGSGSDTAQQLRCVQQAGIAPALLQQAGARVTTGQFATLYRLLAQLHDDETPGMFARPLRGGTLKFLCLSLIGSPSLLTAMNRFCQYFRLQLDDLHFALRPHGPLVQIALQPRTEAVQQNLFAQKMMLKLVHGIASWLAGQKIPLARVDFSHSRPEQGAESVFLYPGPQRFGQPEMALWFALPQLQMPVRQNAASIPGFLARAPGDWMFVSFAEHIISHRVREYLQPRLEQPCSLPEVAAALHFSKRTLARKLQAEGSSFQGIKDALRRDVAIQQLTQGRLPVAAIGQLVGFGDPTSFQRAFREWTGSAPGAYRRRPGIRG